MARNRKVFEVWKAKDHTESVTFLVNACTDRQYHLLTHTVDDDPMEFVAAFAEGSTRRAFDASKDILFSEEGKA